MEKLKLAKHLINFIDESPSNYFACINAKNILNEKDFDIKYNALTAIGQFALILTKPILEEYLQREDNKELREIAKDILAT